MRVEPLDADLVLVAPTETARRASELIRELGVSQVIVSVSTELPLAEKEVVGTVHELELMERLFADSQALEQPVAAIMGPRLPMVGIGEPVSRLVQSLEVATAVLVLDGGHPVAVLSRFDVLAFLGARTGP